MMDAKKENARWKTLIGLRLTGMHFTDKRPGTKAGRILFFSEGAKMLSKIPIDLGRIKKDALNKEILRSAIIAELDAINLYEQMAEMTPNAKIRKVLLDVAKEEKTHVGEFQTLLLIEDREQVHELEEGKKEVQELLVPKKSW
jgi:rubrerythrin